MRKLFGLILILGSMFATSLNIYAADININAKTFPDLYFREYIKQIYDIDGNGKLSDAERNSVKEINIGEDSDYQCEYEFYEADTIKGIEFFTNIENLDCSGNNLDKLDISKNKKLTYLNCSSNQLEKLNIKNNKKLKELNCEYNYIYKIDLKKNKELTKIDIGHNKLSKISLLKNKKIIYLDLSGNKLKNINVNKLKKLETLYCTDNKLTKLNVAKNKKLLCVRCDRNKIRTLNLKKNIQLDELSCAYNKLKKLNLKKNKLLQWLYCNNNNLITGNLGIAGKSLIHYNVSNQKMTIKKKIIGRQTLVPLKNISGTNVIKKISSGHITSKGIKLKRKKTPNKITYKYNMFTDKTKAVKVTIKVK